MTEEFLRIGEKTPGLDVEQALEDIVRGPGADRRERGAGGRFERQLDADLPVLRGRRAGPLELSDLTPEAFSQALAAARGG